MPVKVVGLLASAVPTFTAIPAPGVNALAVEALPCKLPLKNCPLGTVIPWLAVKAPLNVTSLFTDCAALVVLSNLLLALSCTFLTAAGVAAVTPVAAVSPPSVASERYTSPRTVEVASGAMYTGRYLP